VSLRARIAALLAAFAVVLVVCGALMYAALEAADEREAELTQRLTPASQVARDLLADFVEQESGVRGYVITGDRDFLDSFERGRRRADEATARLRSLVGGEPGAIQELEQVLEAQDSWRRFAAGPEIAARRRGDVERARELVITRQGRTRFVRLREEVAELQELVEADRTQAVAQAAEADRRLAWAVALTGGALLLLVVVAGAVMWRSVVRPVASLRASLRRVAGGDLDAPVAAEGPREVRELARDAEAMRRRIRSEVDSSRAAEEGLTQREPVVAALRAQLRASDAEPPGGVRVAGTVHSAEGVLAGDWYEVVTLPGGRVGVVVADVSGHGAAAGSVAAQFKQALVTALSLGRLGPAALEAGRAVLRDDERFVTCVIAELEPASGRLRVTNAGHPPPLVLSVHPEAGLVPARELDGTGMVVSTLGAAAWTSHEVTLAEDELLLLYTDGLIEARDENGRLLGLDGVAAALATVVEPEPQRIVDACLDAARSFRAPTRRDDITLVVLGVRR
jgi:sigma-B regulation protein RsbU (phosphoserine phosphatase)